MKNACLEGCLAEHRGIEATSLDARRSIVGMVDECVYTKRFLEKGFYKKAYGGMLYGGINL